MKFLFSALVCIPLVLSCNHCGGQTCTSSSPAPVSSSQPAPSDVAMLDIPGASGEGLSLEQFVKQCGGVSGFNFTYSKTTQAKLSTEKVPTFGAQRIKAADFEDFIGKMLGTSGFQCARIGPDHLKVLLITPRTS